MLSERSYEPGEEGAARGPNNIARHGAPAELDGGAGREDGRLGFVKLGLRDDLGRGHRIGPADGDVKEAAVGVDEALGDDGACLDSAFDGEAREAKGAAAVGEGHVGEAKDNVREVVGEVEEVADLVGDGAADLVEGAAGDGRGGEAEAAGDGAEGRGVGEAEEGGAELVVGGEGKGRGIVGVVGIRV